MSTDGWKRLNIDWHFLCSYMHIILANSTFAQCIGTLFCNRSGERGIWMLISSQVHLNTSCCLQSLPHILSLPPASMKGWIPCCVSSWRARYCPRWVSAWRAGVLGDSLYILLSAETHMEIEVRGECAALGLCTQSGGGDNEARLEPQATYHREQRWTTPAFKGWEVTENVIMYHV